MTEKKFKYEIEKTLDKLREALTVKTIEYVRNNDVFHNFHEGSKRTGLIREKVLDGFLLKHEISIADMTNDLVKGILPSKEVVEEKFNDNLIYLLIKKMSVLDKIEQQDVKR